MVYRMSIALTEGTINGHRFSHFLQEYLIPQLQPFNGSNPNSIVIIDNVSIHHVCTIVDLIENIEAEVIFLPPYSPHLNPLEIYLAK